jgi:hypothetical protein
MNFSTPDLTQHPPRGARVQLGGLVVLPRMIDKCRATLAGKNGEFHYNCPLDQRLLTFVGIDAEAFKSEVAKGVGDGALLDWVNANSTTKPAEWEVIQWSAWQTGRTASDPDTRDYFNGLHRKCGPQREDIATWFDLLDLDDYVSFGGVA